MNKTNIPKHIAIIMDGNRRWAKNHHLPEIAGHKYALDKVVENLIDQAGKMGISYITFWAWSTENWQRNKREVEGIMKLFSYALKNKVASFHKKGARLKVIGDISSFSLSLQKGIKEALDKTKHNSRITAIFALNYGGRDEIIRAIRKMLTMKQFNNVTMKLFSNYLDTNQIPDPDLIIRTGGEKRLSGFLLWQSEYAELYFTDILFPDFTSVELKKAIDWYKDRNRRFGK